MTKHWLMTRAAIASMILLSLTPIASHIRTAAAEPLALPQPSGDFETAGVIADSYIIVLSDDTFGAASVSDVTQFSIDVHVTHQYGNALHGFSATMTAGEAEQLRNDPRVVAVEPDRKIYQLGAIYDHSLDRINAELNPVTHIDGVDSPRVNVDVAIIDGGVGPSSMIDIEGGKNCTTTKNYYDDNGHGTFAAGLVAGFDNSKGQPGVVPGARIWSVKVMSGEEGTWSDFICGVDWVTSMAGTIEVANISLGGPYPHNEQNCESSLMHAAICRLVNAGVTVIAAAGNGATNAFSSIPARYGEVITVSAIADSDGKPGGLGPATAYGADDHLASFSNDGLAVDIAAPGVNVCSILPYYPYAGCGWGTSFASPLVAGAAAAYIAEHGRVGPAAVRAALLANRDPAHIPGDTDGKDEGVLNASGRTYATLGLSRTAAHVGQSLTLALTGFRPYDTVTIKFDTTVKSTVKVNAAGDGSVTFKVPAAPKGSHSITAITRNYFVKKTLTISPRIRLSSTLGSPGARFDVSLRGFAAKQKVTLKWMNGDSTLVLGSVITSGTGSANFDINAPSAFKGEHAVIAVPSSGGSVTTFFTIRPSVRLSSISGASGSSASLTLKGFASYESVRVYLVTGTSKKLLRTKTVSALGSATSIVTIPVTTELGSHPIFVEGSLGTSMTSAFTVSSLGEAAVTSPSPTATTSATPSASPAFTATPTAAPTEAATAIPTETSTAESTATPSSEPTETPTAIPAETATPEPTVVPTDTPAIEDTATPNS
ncbi:MAG: S8 family serine peptidase [Thermomicrobiales bacterium]